MPPVISTTVLPRKADRVAILVNPKAGARASHPRAERLAELLRGQQFQATIFTDLAEATSTANAWHADGRLRALVGVGGDGTAAELVNRTADGVPVTLLPAGNSNLLARYFQISREAENLCQTIIEGATVRLDAGWANGRIFLLMAGCGFDAEVVRRVHSRRTGHVNDLSYVRPVVEAIWNYKFPEIQVECYDEGGLMAAQLAARWLFVFNLPCYGAGLKIAPHADGSDGMLDLCGFRRGHLCSGVKYACAILLRQHQRLADWTTRRVRRLRITSDQPVPYQLDGDPGGYLPLDIEILPGRMNLVVPAEAVTVRQ